MDDLQACECGRRRRWAWCSSRRRSAPSIVNRRGGRPALSLPARVGPRELGLLGQLATSFVLLARAAPLLLVFSIVLFRQHGDVAGQRRQLVNAGLVLVVAQGLQVLTVAVVLGA